MFDEKISYGTFDVTVPADNFEGVPSDEELAEFLENFPLSITTVAAVDSTIMGHTTHTQYYLNSPPQPELDSPEYPQAFRALSNPTSFQLSNIAQHGSQYIRFRATSVKYRFQVFYDYIGTKVGGLLADQNPEDPNYPSFP